MLPENCSFCHWMISFVPTLIGALIRILNPPRDRSSTVAGATRGFPISSCHNASTFAMTTSLGFFLLTPMHRLSARNQSGSVPVGGQFHAGEKKGPPKFRQFSSRLGVISFGF